MILQNVISFEHTADNHDAAGRLLSLAKASQHACLFLNYQIIISDNPIETILDPNVNVVSSAQIANVHEM